MNVEETNCRTLLRSHCPECTVGIFSVSADSTPKPTNSQTLLLGDTKPLKKPVEVEQQSLDTSTLGTDPTTLTHTSWIE